jgi:hypothetical protein
MREGNDILYKYLDIIIIESQISEPDICFNILYEKHIKPFSKNDRYDDMELCDKIVILGEKLGFLKSLSKENDLFELTEKGIQAKELGGYFKYIESIKNKELESKKLNIIAENYISGNNYGIQSSRSDFIKPTIQNDNKITESKPAKRSLLEIASWVLGSIIAIIGIYEFIIKKIFTNT